MFYFGKNNMERKFAYNQKECFRHYKEKEYMLVLPTAHQNKV